MKNFRVNNVTAQAKMIALNEALGNVGLDKMQGTTRELFDQLPIDGRTEFAFFRNVSTRQFPQTNFDGVNNRLGVGESIVFERAYLSIITTDALDPNDFISETPITGTTTPNIASGVLSLSIANQQVMKPVPILSFVSNFNISAAHINATVFEFDTLLCLPPMVEFTWLLQVPIQPLIDNTELRFTVGGAGAILNTRGTM